MPAHAASGRPAGPGDHDAAAKVAAVQVAAVLTGLDVRDPAVRPGAPVPGGGLDGRHALLLASVRAARRWRRRHPLGTRASADVALPTGWGPELRAPATHPLFAAGTRPVAPARRAGAPLGADPGDATWRWLRGRGPAAAEIGALAFVAGLGAPDIASTLAVPVAQVDAALAELTGAAGTGHLEAAAAALRAAGPREGGGAGVTPPARPSRHRRVVVVAALVAAVTAGAAVAATVVGGGHPRRSTQGGGRQSSMGFGGSARFGGSGPSPLSSGPAAVVVPRCALADLRRGDSSQGGTAGLAVIVVTLVNVSHTECAVPTRPHARLVLPGAPTRLARVVANEPGAVDGLAVLVPGASAAMSVLISVASCGSAPAHQVHQTLVVSILGGTRRFPVQTGTDRPCRVRVGAFTVATG